MISRLYQALSRIGALFFPSHLDRQLDEELDAHIELLTEANLERGMTPESARRQALLSIGSRDAAKELHRDVRAFRFIEDLVQDARFSARLLLRSPFFTLMAAVSLAIGIGADTTVFTAANALLFRSPAAVTDPQRLVDISRTVPGRVGVKEVSYPNYADIRERATTLDGIYLYEPMPRAMSMAGSDGAESLFGATVSLNYFEVLGVRPAAGRLFTTIDDAKGGLNPLVVMSYAFWQQRFKTDPAIVGQTLRINGDPYQIVGVAPEGFQGTTITTPDVWLPPGSTAQDQRRFTMRGVGWGLLGGRLKPDVTVAQAAAEMNAIGLALARDYPQENRGFGLRVTALSPIPGNLVLPVTGIFTLLLVFVSLVLIIACANVAAVLLSRATARQREIAVRLAIGAGRYRLIRQFLTETAMLFILGGGAGLLLSRVLTSLVVSQIPKSDVPVNLSFGLDARVIGFTIGLSLFSSILCGLAPALQSSKSDIVSTLKNDAQTITHRSRMQNAFVIAQVAFSIVLVVAAGLFVGALRRVSSINLGYDPHDVELATIDLNMARYNAATGPAFIRELTERIHALPGLQESTVAAVTPNNGGMFIRLRQPGSAPDPEPESFPRFGLNVVEPTYFATMKIPIVAGRDFDAADRADSQPVAIISEHAARQLWPGQDPLGRHLPSDVGDPGGLNANGAVVVGVAGEVKSMNGPNPFFPLVYRPLQQQYFGHLAIAARTAHGQRRAADIRAALFSLNPNVPVLSVQTLEEATAANMTPQRNAASVTGTLGVVGLLLASIGVYGVTAYAVTRRTRELGIRMALGAERRDITGLVLREGMSLVAIGAGIGLVLAFAASRMVQRSLLNIPPLDVLSFLGSAVLFSVVGLIACGVPVYRATRIDAVAALRHE